MQSKAEWGVGGVGAGRVALGWIGERGAGGKCVCGGVPHPNPLLESAELRRSHVQLAVSSPSGNVTVGRRCPATLPPLQ